MPVENLSAAMALVSLDSPLRVKTEVELANADFRFTPQSKHPAGAGMSEKCPIPDSCTATKVVLFATSLPRLSIGCAITELIATAVSNHAGRPADVWSNADSCVAKPSQAVQYRRDWQSSRGGPSHAVPPRTQ